MKALFIVAPSGIEALVIHAKALTANDSQRSALVKRLQKSLQPVGSCLNWAPRENPLPSHLLMLAANQPPQDFWRATADALSADLRIEVEYIEANADQWDACEASVTVDEVMFKVSKVFAQILSTTLGGAK